MSNDKNDIVDKIKTEFRNSSIRDILKSQFTNGKIKINEEPVSLIAKLVKVMTVESAMRAAAEAEANRKTTVDLNHIETVITNLLLDFP
ncbi:PREDICTED: centromere protein X-like [Nicrophorus vespilloides]|uniref:Centromere protein X n=1 Tax=Nicrophorus vespilloides TaxID=110193 RepID=A0ABM1MCP6_NICVS|nr:PREDICTED: centromere protein X-like [Nicrophorus vespilloides]